MRTRGAVIGGESGVGTVAPQPPRRSSAPTGADAALHTGAPGSDGRELTAVRAALAYITAELRAGTWRNGDAVGLGPTEVKLIAGSNPVSGTVSWLLARCVVRNLRRDVGPR